MKTKKRTFTLLELLVSLPLIALLISFFLFSLKFFYFSQKQQEQLLIAVKESFYFKYRLRKMLLSLPEKERDLQLEKDSLFFKMDHGVHIEPKASQKVKAKLFLEQGQLHLQIYYDDEKLLREEIYFHDILSLDYLWGYHEKNVWEYKKEVLKNQKPLSLKIKIQKKDKEETFLFAL